MTRKKYTARGADRHDLYEKSVQNADHDAGFVNRLFKKLRGRTALTMKEDFCGTHAFCCEWVKLSGAHRALGLDLDQGVLEWGRLHNVSRLKEEQQSRVTVRKKNVLGTTTPRVDVVSAFNVSYFIFKTRPDLLRYFQNAHRSLVSDGAFFLDLFGGSECYLVQEERRQCEGFTYVWEHADYNPLTGEILCKIHFEFRDGTAKRNAFVYDWRMWSLVEIRELLSEAGFQDVQIYWEGTDHETGEGNGIYRPTTRGEACQTWIAYLVALK